jgi:hypothetical protein
MALWYVISPEFDLLMPTSDILALLDIIVEPGWVTKAFVKLNYNQLV